MDNTVPLKFFTYFVFGLNPIKKKIYFLNFYNNVTIKKK